MQFDQYIFLVLKLPRLFKRCIVIFLDIFLCLFSTWLSFALRLDSWNWVDGVEWLVFILSFCFSFPLFFYFGLYVEIFRYIGLSALSSITKAFLSYLSLFAIIFLIIGIDGVPRSIGIIQPILFFILIGSSRFLTRHWLNVANRRLKSINRQSSISIIYGAGSSGRQLLAGLTSAEDLVIKCFVDDDMELCWNSINGVPVFPSSNLQDLIKRFEVTDVLLAIPSASQSRRIEIITKLNVFGVRVRTLPGLIDLAHGRIWMPDFHDVEINTLLGRDIVPPNINLLEQNIRNKIILVTGAGGSIGSELCRQIIEFMPSSLILVDNSEHALYSIYEELNKLCSQQEIQTRLDEGDGNIDFLFARKPRIKLVPSLTSVRDVESLFKIFNTHRPNTVFHAAAYKHVPLVESNPVEGIRNNIFGTLNCAQISLEAEVSHFIFISTDKAVRPTNIMGASKRISELVIQGISDQAILSGKKTIFSMVRFGNVLGSSGSVIPLFRSQIRSGGPITLTHPDITRYFMTITEAAQLVIQAGSMATGGDVFVLDMGGAVRIYDLASKMVRMSGLIVRDEFHPHGDLEIKVTGLRPGEKLHEELLIGDNPESTYHPKIMKAHEAFLSWDKLNLALESLELALKVGNLGEIKLHLKILVPGYKPNED